jgi:hypothetical protein
VRMGNHVGTRLGSPEHFQFAGQSGRRTPEPRIVIKYLDSDYSSD